MGIAIIALLILLALLATPVIVWGGVERAFDIEDDEVCDRDRTRECRRMLSEMETTKGTKGTK